MSTHSQQRNSFFGILIGVAGLVVVALIAAGVYVVTGSSSSAPSVGSRSDVVSAETEVEAEPVAVSNETASEPVEAEVAAEPEAVVEAEPVEPAVEAEPVAVVAEPEASADLTLAVADRSLNCTLLTEAITSVMEEEYDMNVALVEFDSADSLFTALSDGEVDMTLCFVDPEDRAQISGVNNDRIGYMRQVGSSIWDSGEGKLQIWAFGGAKSDLRSDHPCALNLLENVAIADGDLNANSADEWLSNNATSVESWTVCNK